MIAIIVKAAGRNVALALLAAQLITIAAVASPLDLNDGSPALWSRAQGAKLVGSVCKANAECFSANCQITSSTNTTLTCQLQPYQGPCSEDGNCVSRNCEKGTCSNAAGLLGPCAHDDDCDDWRNFKPVVCSQGLCKIKENKDCKANAECTTGLCDNKICRRSPQSPNAACFTNSECLSGSCKELLHCTKKNGTLTACDSVSEKHCSRFQLGERCANTGECASGFCRNGVCVAGKVGDTCLEQYQCSASLLCGSNGKCYQPKNGIASPTGTCSTNSQCASGRCLGTTLVRDSDGVNAWNNATLRVDPKQCDYLHDGQASCRTYKDCASGLCKSGKCAPGKAGDRCLVNYQCEGLCGLDGICFTPTQQASQGAKQPCKTGSDCLSDTCDNAELNTLQRPSLLDPEQTLTVRDGSCQQAYLGEGCRKLSDCAEGVCSSGKCTPVRTGNTCSADEQCATRQCTSGTCVLAGTGINCKKNTDCFSNDCHDSPCFYYFENPCTSYLTCSAILTGGTCRDGRDCEGDATCAPDRTCRVLKDYPCKKDGDCLSKNCIANSFCTPGDCSTPKVCGDPLRSTTTLSSTPRTSKPPTSSTRTASSASHSTTKTKSTSSSSKTSSASPTKTSTI
ncbi:unnamed protein product [Tilletia controversa]|nr:unnamed protein product [Tilletia controversa]CAD6975712.1 unnamed protein product [Tilletia controversa]